MQTRDGATTLCLRSLEIRVAKEDFQVDFAPVKNSEDRKEEPRDNEQRGHVKSAPVTSAAPLPHIDAMLPASQSQRQKPMRLKLQHIRGTKPKLEHN